MAVAVAHLASSGFSPRGDLVCMEDITVEKVLDGIVALARKMNVQIVAEGVEKPEEMPDSMPVRLQGGITMVFDDYGRLKYDIGTNVTGGNQSGDMRHVNEQPGTDAVGDIAKTLPVDHARIGGESGHDHLGLMFFSQ